MTSLYYLFYFYSYCKGSFFSVHSVYSSSERTLGKLSRDRKPTKMTHFELWTILFSKFQIYRLSKNYWRIASFNLITHFWSFDFFFAQRLWLGLCACAQNLVDTPRMISHSSQIVQEAPNRPITVCAKINMRLITSSFLKNHVILFWLWLLCASFSSMLPLFLCSALVMKIPEAEKQSDDKKNNANISESFDALFRVTDSNPQPRNNLQLNHINYFTLQYSTIKFNLL